MENLQLAPQRFELTPQQAKELALICVILRENLPQKGSIFNEFDLLHDIACAWIDEYGIGNWGDGQGDPSDPRTDMEFDEAVIDFAHAYLFDIALQREERKHP